MFDSIGVGGRAKAAALVVGKFKGEKIDASTKKLDPDGSIAAAFARAEFAGDAGSSAIAYPEAGYERVVVVGLGDAADFGTDRLRLAGAAAARALAGTGVKVAEVSLPGLSSSKRTPKGKVHAGRAGSAFAEGAGLAVWRCEQFRGKATPSRKYGRLTLRSSDRSFASGMKRGAGLAESANWCRTLSQTPPNVATPDYMAKQARTLTKHGCKVTVLRGAQLDKERLVGLKTVGQASDHTPCLIRIEWAPQGTARQRPAVLIGKTVTYDSGGLSLKINNSMKGMKRDKDGGCAVLGAMHAVAAVLKPKRRVVALLSAAENAISDEAYRPDDVITFRNGVTVEVTNTDAEGRLVMADALCWSCDKEDPAYIVDVATLTGGVVVALGSAYAGLWCDDDDLRERIETAGEGAGERVWRLPLNRQYRDMMKSPIADVHNSAPVREAHPIQGAAFLSYFVDNGVPWAHIDIAGVHATDSQKGPIDPGPTGYGTRLLAELLDSE